MKLVAAGVLAALFGVMLLPAVLAGGDDPGLDGCGNAVDGDPLAVILTTIATIETGGNYETRVRSSTASGAYGFIDASWRHYAQIAGVETARHPAAWMAPPADQDAVAAAYVDEILTDHHGRVEIIPLAWYLPSAINDPATMDVVPPIGANVLTPRQYQTRWIAQYERELQRAGITDPAAPATTVPPAAGGATTSPRAPSTLPSATPGSCHGAGITPLAGDWSLPGPRTLIDANPDALDDPHHDYPAWDWVIAANTPIYAVRGGHVDTVRNWPHNWWSRSCGQAGGPGCDTCGVGVTIVDDTGWRWTYCHGTNLTVRLGDTVTAGQQIMWSGNTGRSGTAHLHLEIRTNGTRRCPQPLLESLYHDADGIDPVTLPTTGCTF